MRAVIFGGHGQLATALTNLLPDVVCLGRNAVDICQESQVESSLLAFRPDVLVNCAAYNAVDKAETDLRTCYRTNHVAVARLARWCDTLRIKLVHISSDYVFSGYGRSEPYTEVDKPQPLSVYGTSKWLGELAAATCGRHMIVRTCGLYGGVNSFVSRIQTLTKSHQQLRVVADNQCSPSSCADVAKGIVALIDAKRHGLYHVVNSGAASWYDVACEVARSTDCQIVPIKAAEYGAAAARPAYSVLSCELLKHATGVVLPDWRQALQQYLSIQRRTEPD